MLGHLDLCGSDICSELDEAVGPPTVFTRLAAGEDIDIRFLAEITYANITAAGLNWEDAGELCSLAICEDTVEGSGASTASQLLYSDGGWCGTPFDVARSNTLYEDRLLSPATISRSIPYVPEFPRRAGNSSGDIRANGSDGELDSLLSAATIDGRTIKLFVGPSNGSFTDFEQILELLGDSIAADNASVLFRVKSSTSLLDVPLQTQTYTGAGGINGDSGLAGQLRPLLYGECFNVTPTLLNFDKLIYQVHTGQVEAFDAIKDKGVPLTWDGVDHTSFTSLRAATVAAGYYTTAESIGMFRLGSTPAGKVTADVRGDVNAGSYSDETGEILRRLAVGNALIPVSQIDLAGFNDLPDDPIGFYADGSFDYQVSEVFDRLLRPINGWYGQLNDSRIAVGLVDPPDAAAYAWAFGSDDILDIAEDPVEVRPRYSQSVSYAKNWTPLDLSDLAVGNPALTESAVQALTSPTSWYTEEDPSVRQRYSGAEKAPDIEGYFVERDGAIVAARDRIMALLRVPRRLMRIRTKLQGLNVNLNSVGIVTHPRFGASAGKAVTVREIAFDASRSEVEIIGIA